MGTKKLGCVLLGIMAGVCIAEEQAKPQRTWREILIKFDETVDALEKKVTGLPTEDKYKSIFSDILYLIKEMPMASLAKSVDDAQKRAAKVVEAIDKLTDVDEPTKDAMKDVAVQSL